MHVRIKRFGNNIVIQQDTDPVKTITVPSGYNDDKIFALVYKLNEGSKAAEQLFLKEVDKYTKPVAKNQEVLAKRIEKRIIEKEIKKIQSFDYSSLPINLNSDWLNVLNTQPDNQHIKNFLLLLSLNPNKFTRDNLLRRLSSKFPYITSMGYLVLTRQVWAIDKGGDELYDFIQSSYIKIKGQKKGVDNYKVVDSGRHEYKIVNKETIDHVIGNLGDLYRTYPKPTGRTVYCSNYNKNKEGLQESWNIGDIVEIANPNFEDEMCGTDRLHVKTSPFSNIGNKEYGNTTVIVLINPRDIISCREDWKITCSKFKICSVVTDAEIKDTFTQDFQKWDYDYAVEDFEEIKKLSQVATKDMSNELKDKDKQKISSLKKTIVSTKPVERISNVDFGKIIEDRVSLIK